MALNAFEEECTLREWAPLTKLFQILPTKTQHGLFYTDLKLTCVDVISEYIALGTNSGVVYCYDRKRNDLQRMRCENVNSPITVVKIISTVDYMLACGNRDGNVSIFQIPKIPPENLPTSLRPKNKQVERYTVSEIHKGPITAIEWSKNGMKLFSGDSYGIVVLTEIDFYMHLCKSVEIVNETYEIIQLSYHQQFLLISTTYRSIICQKQDKWRVCQVGKQDRKILGHFGGVFYQNGLRPTDVILYCSRPGLRIWISDLKGTVQQTLLFKDILNQQFPEVPILNPLGKHLKKHKPAKEANFGPIYNFAEDLLVTFNNDVVYILNPKDLQIVATLSHLRGVLGLALNKDEIFILEGERSLIRIGFTPETFTENESRGTHSNNTFLPNTLRELSQKIQTTNIIPPITETTNLEQLNLVMHAEEACESPRLNKSHPETQDESQTYQNTRNENKLTENNFNDMILLKHQRHKKSDMVNSVCSVSSSSSDERETNVTKPMLMDVSTIAIMPDLRSPDSIQSDIKQKEKMLADLLNFDNIKIDLSQLEKNKCDTEVLVNVNSSDKQIKNVIIEEPIVSNGETDAELFRSSENVVQMEAQTVKKENVLSKEIENGIKNDIPVCKTLPVHWEVHPIKADDNESPCTSFNDWEIMSPGTSFSDWEII